MDLEQEQKLVEEAKTDTDAFGQLYDRYYPKIFNYILRRVGDVPTSEDITTAVFLKGFGSLSKFKWRGVPFSAWLYRIASNEIAGHFRHKRSSELSLDELLEAHGFEPVSDIDIEASYIAAEDKIQRHEQFLSVQAQLRTLPLKYQEVLALRYFEKKSIDEIAVILGKPQGTVKSLISRGTAKLRATLQNSAEGQDATFFTKARSVDGDKNHERA